MQARAAAASTAAAVVQEEEEEICGPLPVTKLEVCPNV